MLGLGKVYHFRRAAGLCDRQYKFSMEFDVSMSRQAQEGGITIDGGGPRPLLKNDLRTCSLAIRSELDQLYEDVSKKLQRLCPIIPGHSVPEASRVNASSTRTIASAGSSLRCISDDGSTSHIALPTPLMQRGLSGWSASTHARPLLVPSCHVASPAHAPHANIRTTPQPTLQQPHAFPSSSPDSQPLSQAVLDRHALQEMFLTTASDASRIRLWEAELARRMMAHTPTPSATPGRTTAPSSARPSCPGSPLASSLLWQHHHQQDRSQQLAPVPDSWHLRVSSRGRSRLGAPDLTEEQAQQQQQQQEQAREHALLSEPSRPSHDNTDAPQPQHSRLPPPPTSTSTFTPALVVQAQHGGWLSTPGTIGLTTCNYQQNRQQPTCTAAFTSASASLVSCNIHAPCPLALSDAGTVAARPAPRAASSTARTRADGVSSRRSHNHAEAGSVSGSSSSSASSGSHKSDDDEDSECGVPDLPWELAEAIRRQYLRSMGVGSGVGPRAGGAAGAGTYVRWPVPGADAGGPAGGVVGEGSCAAAQPAGDGSGGLNSCREGGSLPGCAPLAGTATTRELAAAAAAPAPSSGPAGPTVATSPFSTGGAAAVAGAATAGAVTSPAPTAAALPPPVMQPARTRSCRADAAALLQLAGFTPPSALSAPAGRPRRLPLPPLPSLASAATPGNSTGSHSNRSSGDGRASSGVCGGSSGGSGRGPASLPSCGRSSGDGSTASSSIGSRSGSGSGPASPSSSAWGSAASPSSSPSSSPSPSASAEWSAASIVGASPLAACSDGSCCGGGNGSGSSVRPSCGCGGSSVGGGDDLVLGCG